MKIKNILISLIVVILLGLAGWAYWYFLMGPVKVPLTPPATDDPSSPGFRPLDRGTSSTGGTGTVQGTSTQTGIVQRPGVQPTLRLLSDTPVSGYGASTTASTTKVLWTDRGRGKVFEATYDSVVIKTISNTVVPKIFKLVWNKNLTAFIGSLFEDASLTPTTVYAELIKQPGATSTSTVAPYELKGRNISGTVIGYASSPDKTQVFMLMNEDGNGVGYISGFNFQNPTRIFTTPITELSVAWPSDGILALTTKGSASYGGYLYFVNPKTGTWTKVLGPIPGLSTAVNDTGKYIFYSGTGRNNDIISGIYSVAAGTSTDPLIRTLAEKCAWGNLYKEIVYCGVPNQLPSARYPDDWYFGTVSTVDKVWQVNATTGEAAQTASLVEQSDRVINVFNPELDPRDKYLFFMNKNDLSLWSLDVTKSR